MVKWKNVDIGAAYYYITGTCTEWLPLLNNPQARKVVCAQIAAALERCDGHLSAFVLMPDHIHLLVYLPGGELHRFNRNWRAKSAREIIALAQEQGSRKVLDAFARHANGKARYAVWKEQARALPIHSEKKLYEIVNYIHANPVRRGLVEHPRDWEHSSWLFYEQGSSVMLDVEPVRL